MAKLFGNGQVDSEITIIDKSIRDIANWQTETRSNMFIRVKRKGMFQCRISSRVQICGRWGVLGSGKKFSEFSNCKSNYVIYDFLVFRFFFPFVPFFLFLLVYMIDFRNI